MTGAQYRRLSPGGYQGPNGQAMRPQNGMMPMQPPMQPNPQGWNNGAMGQMQGGGAPQGWNAGAMGQMAQMGQIPQAIAQGANGPWANGMGGGGANPMAGVMSAYGQMQGGQMHPGVAPLAPGQSPQGVANAAMGGGSPGNFSNPNTGDRFTNPAVGGGMYNGVPIVPYAQQGQQAAQAAMPPPSRQPLQSPQPSDRAGVGSAARGVGKPIGILSSPPRARERR